MSFVERFSSQDLTVGGLATALVIDLLFLPWFVVTYHFGPVPLNASASATGTPDGWLGVLALLATLALIADVVVARQSPETQLPSLGGSRATTRLTLAGASAAFLGLKFILHIDFGDLDVGFWGAALLSGGLVYVTRREHLAPTATAR